MPPSPSDDMVGKEEHEKMQRVARVTPFTTTTSRTPRSTGGETEHNTYLVDYMTDEQVSEMFRMICAAGEHGQGFGHEEYADEAEFRAEIADGYSFAVMDKNDGVMVAAFVLAVSKYSRGCLVADPYIVVRSDCRGRGLGALCMDLCVALAPRLQFLGLYVDTFSNNEPMLRIIRSVPGMRQVGCLPLGGVMKDGQVVSSLIFYKDLRHHNDG